MSKFKNLVGFFTQNKANKIAIGIIGAASLTYAYASYESYQTNNMSSSERAALIKVDTSGIKTMALGSPEAPVTITEYASFTCSHCADFANETFPKLKEDFIDTGMVRFIHQDVFTHKAGLWASMIARCDGGEKFFPITKDIFKHFSSWTGATEGVETMKALMVIGAQNGLSAENLKACMNDEAKADALVAWSLLARDKDDIKRTPTLVIDGEKVGDRDYVKLKNFIENKIASAKADQQPTDTATE